MDRDTSFLLPPDVRDWLPQGHLAWTVIDAVETLDLAALISSYRLGGRGQRAYDPTMMLTPLIYAYCCGQTSSCQIERLCEHDVAFRVITGNQRPDHDTLAAFRVRHHDALKGLFAQVLALCRAAGSGPGRHHLGGRHEAARERLVVGQPDRGRHREDPR